MSLNTFITYCLAFICPLIWLLVVSIANMIFWKRSISEVISISILESVAILYICGFFDLRIGVVVCLALWCGCIIYIMTQREAIRSDFLIEQGFISSICVFLVLYTFTNILNVGKDFFHWDEVSHWGMMAKDLYYTNRYYIFEEARLSVHNEYPPLMALIEYFWCKLSCGYSESYLYNGKIIFSFSLILPLVCNVDEKKSQRLLVRIIKVIIDTFIIILLPLLVIIGEATFYRTIYAESVMMVIFLCCVWDYINNDRTRFGTIRTCLLLFALSISKQIAIYFVVIVWLMWVVRIVCEKNERVIHASNWHIAGMIASPGITIIIWKIATKIYCSSGQFDVSKGDVGAIMNVLLGRDDTYRSEVLEKYISSIFCYRLSVGRFQITYFGCSLILILTFAIIMVMRKREEISELITIIVLALCYISYIGVMLISYLYGFSEAEAKSLACYERYMNTMLFAVVLSTIMLLMRMIKKRGVIPEYMLKIFFLVVLILIVDPQIYADELRIGKQYDSPRGIYEGDAKIVSQYTSEYSEIYVIYQDTNGSANNWLSYLTYPRKISEYYYNICNQEKNDGKQKMSVEEFLDYAAQYDYVYLGNVDDEFRQNYCSAFPKNEEISNQILFCVKKDTNNVELVYECGN